MEPHNFMLFPWALPPSSPYHPCSSFWAVVGPVPVSMAVTHHYGLQDTGATLSISVCYLGSGIIPSMTGQAGGTNTHGCSLTS